jgi:hypothetical protein
MSCGKCRSGKLCPVSFGLALGIVAGLAVFIESLWVMYYGMPPMMVQLHLPVPTLEGATMHALKTLLKGFVFGFFIALFYDLISCCCKKCRWCKKSDEVCVPADKSELPR